jgi:hypothetical protein
MGHEGNALGTQNQIVLHSTEIDKTCSLEYRKRAQIPRTQDSVAYKGKKALDLFAFQTSPSGTPRNRGAYEKQKEAPDLFAFHTSASGTPARAGRPGGKKKHTIALRFTSPLLGPVLLRTAFLLLHWTRTVLRQIPLPTCESPTKFQSLYC